MPRDVSARARAVPVKLLSETQEMIRLAKWLDSIGVVWFHPANEGIRRGKTGAIARMCGLKTGVPDVIIITPSELNGMPTVIELKRSDKTLDDVSDDQNRWLDIFHNHGFVALVAFGHREAIARLRLLGYGGTHGV